MKISFESTQLALLALASLLGITSAWTTSSTRINRLRKVTDDDKGREFRNGINRRTCTTQLYSQAATKSVENLESTVATADSRVSLAYGILISSFTDGMTSHATQEFFKYSLASLLTMDTIIQTEEDIETSAKFSPCQGPDIDLLDQMELGDEMIQSQRSEEREHEEESSEESLQSQDSNRDRVEKTRKMVQYLQNSISNNGRGGKKEIKVLYIPTAMYALRSDSNNSPGKQRQRARADGRKRRNQLVQYISDIFENSEEDEHHRGESDGLLKLNVNILATTLDVDDGSIKQSVGSDDASQFPKDGKEALTHWNPHVIYVEGGNTFWLHHCMTKPGKGGEDWMQLVHDACCTGSSSNRPALYIGKSAGAILAGKYVETATWKGWDDPSVVPGKETYEDWLHDNGETSDSSGLNFVGGASFFPHMSDDWLGLVDEKKDSLPQDGDLYCLQEWDACCVEGSTQDVYIS